MGQKFSTRGEIRLVREFAVIPKELDALLYHSGPLCWDDFDSDGEYKFMKWLIRKDEEAAHRINNAKDRAEKKKTRLAMKAAQALRAREEFYRLALGPQNTNRAEIRSAFERLTNQHS